MKETPLRLVLYDDTDRRHHPPLTYAWLAGARLYRALGWIDHYRAAASWEEGLRWLAEIDPGRSIGEIQYWGHGKWGCLMLNGTIMDSSALIPGSPLLPSLQRIKARLAGPGALWWFRSCEAFGARKGQAFARAWADFFNCSVAGHTFIIGFHQSGLHMLKPGESPAWAEHEGLAEGTPEEPLRALCSRPGEPSTITCLHHRLPGTGGAKGSVPSVCNHD